MNFTFERFKFQCFVQLTVDILLSQCLLPSESDDEYFDAEDGDTQMGKSMKGSERKKVSEAPNEELINLLLKFEIKEVCPFFAYKQIYYHCFCKLSHARSKH